MQNELITVPNFTFQQGSVSKGDTDFENPISVEFYNGTICLKQEGEFDIPETVSIHPKYLEKFFKAIKKNLPEATEWLQRK